MGLAEALDSAAAFLVLVPDLPAWPEIRLTLNNTAQNRKNTRFIILLLVYRQSTNQTEIQQFLGKQPCQRQQQQQMPHGSRVTLRQKSSHCNRNSRASKGTANRKC